MGDRGGAAEPNHQDEGAAEPPDTTTREPAPVGDRGGAAEPNHQDEGAAEPPDTRHGSRPRWAIEAAQRSPTISTRAQRSRRTPGAGAGAGG